MSQIDLCFKILNLRQVLPGLSRVEIPMSFYLFFPFVFTIVLRGGDRIPFKLSHLPWGGGRAIVYSPELCCHREGPFSDPQMQPAASMIFCMSLSFPVAWCLFVGTNRLLYRGEPVCTGFFPSFCPLGSIVREEEFPLPFSVLLSRIRIKLAWDRLIGENQI